MRIDKALRLNAAYKAATATEKAKKMAIDKSHDYIALGYTLMSAADILFRETEKIMKIVDPLYSYQDSMEIGKSLQNLQSVLKRMDEKTSKIDGLFTQYDSGSYDRLRNNAYEALRFIMLLYTRTCGDDLATKNVNDYLIGMKSNGLFSDAEIAGFQMR